MLGKKFELFYTEEDRKNKLPDKLLKEARETGKAVQEGWRVRKNGTKFWGTIVITALHNKNGEVIGFSKVTRDLTEKKRTEDKLAAYTAELEIQNSELEQFAYVASHDLQEPLRKIQTFTGLIQENIDDTVFVKTYFEKLDSSARRMSELVKSLLNYSRLSQHKEKEYEDKVDLAQLLKEVSEDFELLIGEKKAVIESNNLPVIRGNRMQLGQLFSNLIGNSLKFSTRPPIIKISCSVVDRNKIEEAPKTLIENKYLEIKFEDNGIGFEEKYSKKIFSLFQRLHGKQTFAGTGIGLALCKRIVENHSGYIYAVSEPGVGATFFVYLPDSRYLGGLATT